MLRTVDNNEEVLNNINFKLEKDYSKLTTKKQSETTEKVVDALTLGTDSNGRLIGGTLGLTSVPLAVGVASAVAGMVSLAPMVLEPMSEEKSALLSGFKQFGEGAIEFGFNTMQESLPLLLVPVGVAAISLSVKLYKSLKDKKEVKKEWTGATIELIDDLLQKKEDPTLEFASTFMRKVDLSENDQKENLGLLKYIAYHRAALQAHQKGNVDYETVHTAYSYIMYYLEEMKYSDAVSEKFKNNRFVNILLDDFKEEKKKEEILGQGRKR